MAMNVSSSTASNVLRQTQQQQAQNTEQPKPVVNAQGQTTGTRINVKA